MWEIIRWLGYFTRGKLFQFYTSNKNYSTLPYVKKGGKGVIFYYNIENLSVYLSVCVFRTTMPVVRTGKIYVYLLWTTRGIMYIDIAWQAGKNATAGEEKSSTLRHESTSKQIFSYSENKNMTVEHFKYLKTRLYLTDQKCLSLKYVK